MAFGNSPKPYEADKSTGPRKLNVSQMNKVCDWPVDSSLVALAIDNQIIL